MEKRHSLLPDYYYYLDHLSEFKKKYDGKFLVIVDKKIFGVYDTLQDAVNHALEKYEMGDFTVQEVGAEEHLPRVRMPKLYAVRA